MVRSHCPTPTQTQTPIPTNCNSTQWHCCVGAVWTPPHNSLQPILCRCLYRSRCRAVWTHHKGPFILCNDTSNTVLIENKGVSRKYIAIPFWSDSTVFNENSIVIVITQLTQRYADAWCKRAQKNRPLWICVNYMAFAAASINGSHIFLKLTVKVELTSHLQWASLSLFLLKHLPAWWC